MVFEEELVISRWGRHPQFGECHLSPPVLERVQWPEEDLFIPPPRRSGRVVVGESDEPTCPSLLHGWMWRTPLVLSHSLLPTNELQLDQLAPEVSHFPL